MTLWNILLLRLEPLCCDKNKPEKINEQVSLSFLKRDLLSACPEQAVVCPVVDIKGTASFQATSSGWSLITSASRLVECCLQHLDPKILEDQHPGNRLWSFKCWGLLLVLKDTSLFPLALHPCAVAVVIQATCRVLRQELSSPSHYFFQAEDQQET